MVEKWEQKKLPQTGMYTQLADKYLTWGGEIKIKIILIFQCYFLRYKNKMIIQPKKQYAIVSNLSKLFSHIDGLPIFLKINTLYKICKYN